MAAASSSTSQVDPYLDIETIFLEVEDERNPLQAAASAGVYLQSHQATGVLETRWTLPRPQCINNVLFLYSSFRKVGFQGDVLKTTSVYVEKKKEKNTESDVVVI